MEIFMRRKYNDYNSKNHVFIIGFIIIAVASVIVCILSKNALEKIEKNHTDSNLTVDSTTTDISDQIITKPEEIIPVQESSLLTSFSEMCKELTDMNIILDKEVNKTYKINLNDLAQQGDSIESFTFTFYSQDGTSNMGIVKGGFGISVDPSCPVMTDDSWYQNPNDFSVESQGASCEVTWTVPNEIKEYINADSGKLLFGYWWSDVSSIRLDKVICKKSLTKKIPVDGTQKINIGQTISYTDSSPQKFTFPLDSLVEEGQTPQFISVKISTTQPVEKFTGQIGITTNSLNDKYYTEDNIVVFSNDSSANIDWFIPEEIKKDIDHSGNFDFTFDSCNNQDIIIDNIYMKRECGMSTIKKVAAVVSFFAIGLLIYTVSTLKKNDIPASGSPAGCLSTTSAYDTKNNPSIESVSVSAVSDTETSVTVLPVTTVPAEDSSGENKTYIIVPFSKNSGKAPPERIKPVPVVTPSNIVIKSIPLVCHDTQPSEEAEDNVPEEEIIPGEEMLPETDTTDIYTEPPQNVTSSQTSVITSSDETSAQITTNNN